ncbi:unnamed protein product [Oikopleura dioica]|uniref:Uncharacterized protein n=1 Tax=Oikopleura dioica TaxID=34765 RepID=E4X1N7_OIKDI|nr:unnamed protein product [Oikopleura dioica]
MPFYVVQDRRGYKFEDGVLERGLKTVTPALETDINLIQNAKNSGNKKNKKNETSEEEDSGSDSEDESEEEADFAEIEIDAVDVEVQEADADDGGDSNDDSLNDDEIGSELDKGLDRLDCAAEDEMRDDNQHDVIYLSGMSNTASIAGEITDMDSYIIDDYQDQTVDQTSYLLI